MSRRQRIEIKWNSKLCGGVGWIEIWDGDILTYRRGLATADAARAVELLAPGYVSLMAPQEIESPIPAVADVREESE